MELGNFVSEESLVKSALQYAMNTLVFPLVGTIAGLAIGILTYLTQRGDPYAGNWTFTIRMDENNNIVPTYTKVPEGVKNELDPVKNAMNTVLRSYAQSADDLGFERVPVTLTVFDDASYAVHEWVSISPGGAYQGDYAANMTRAVLGALLATYSIYPSVEAIRASTPDPSTLSADQCKAVIADMYAARADDVMAVIKDSFSNPAALDNFRAQAHNAANVAQARYQACQDAARAQLLTLTGEAVDPMPGGLATWEETQWRQEHSAWPAYKDEPWTVQIVGGGGFDYTTGQEAGAATPVVVTGAAATAVIEEQSNPFANWFEIYGST